MPESGEIPAKTQDIQETEQTGEWAPDVSLRPHHFFNPDIRSAIADKDRPKISRTDLFMSAGHYQERITQKLSHGYFQDVTGKSSEDLNKFLESKDNFVERLRHLPDDSVICLDIKPDEICNSCVIGKHCTAINVRIRPQPFPINNFEEKEKARLDEIHRALLASGFKEREDFVFKDSDNVMFDFDGKPLNQVAEPAEKQVNFKSMLVKMGALRQIA